MGRKPVRVKLNPDLLIWARTSAGYSEEEISKSVGTSADSVIAWEEGAERPTIRQLEKFANKVKRPLAALFLSFPPEEPPPPKDFRMLPETRLGAFTPETMLAFRRSRNLQNTMIELIESLSSDIKSLSEEYFKQEAGDLHCQAKAYEFDQRMCRGRPPCLPWLRADKGHGHAWRGARGVAPITFAIACHCISVENRCLKKYF